MRLESITVRGMGPFSGESHVDLRGLPGVLTALVGKNGAGKSTFMELLPGAMYRECPTRGSLASLATGRDSMIEATVVNGSRWTLRQLVDAVSGKGEAVILDDAGAPVTQSGKVRDADAWVSAHLPAPAVFFSTIFASQKTAGFLGMKPAERKSVLLRVLGIEHLEQLAAKAREHMREADQSAKILSARLADERARGGDAGALESHLADLQTAAAFDAETLTLARAELEAARAAHATALAAWEVGQAHVAKVDRLQRELEAASHRLKSAMAAGDAAGAAAANATPIAALEAAVATARRALDSAKATHATEVAGYDAAQVAVKRHEALTVEQRDLDTRAGNNRRLLANADAVREAVAQVAHLDEAIALAAAEVDRLDGEYRTVQDQRAAGADERIGSLREGLGYVVSELESDSATCALDAARRTIGADDAAIALANDLPNRLWKARNAADEARRSVAKLQADRAAAAKVAASAGALDAAEAKLAAYGERLAVVARELAELGEVRKPLLPREAPVQAATVALTRAESALSFGRTALAIAERDQAAALASVRELSPQVDRMREELQGLQGVEVVPQPDSTALDTAAMLARAAERRDQEARGAVTAASQRLADARASAERSAALEGELGTAHANLGDWTRLAADLGKDGLQAMEIDAAGPELTAITNEILHTCHGPRWTVSIETQKLSADGKKILEGCEVRVLDSVRGRDAAAESLSGGEATIVGEAVSLALTTVACRRQGVTRPTLVRDESGAALDPENAPIYLAMLRHAARLLDADRVLFVSHSREMQELADSRIEIRDGKIEVMG